jgi:hypothetical protein
MAGRKAELTANAIRNLILRFQTTGPRGVDRSYYRLVLITWAAEPEVHPGCNVTPVRHFDSANVVLRGDGGPSNMARALEFAREGLSRYVSEVLEPHTERSSHPLPAVILFSDGLNETSDPVPVAKQIRELGVDEDTVSLAAVGVSAEDSEPANEDLLRSLVCPEHYLPISESNRLYRGFGDDLLATMGPTKREYRLASRDEIAAVLRRMIDRQMRDSDDGERTGT